MILSHLEAQIQETSPLSFGLCAVCVWGVCVQWVVTEWVGALKTTLLAKRTLI